MRTADLVDLLARDAAPVAANVPARRIAADLRRSEEPGQAAQGGTGSRQHRAAREPEPRDGVRDRSDAEAER